MITIYDFKKSWISYVAYIWGEFVKILVIIVCDFPSKMAILALKMKVLKFLGIEPIFYPFSSSWFTLNLGRDIRGDEYEQVWNQLEAEIHLHRHKTVIRACRQNLVSLFNYYRRTISYNSVHIRTYAFHSHVNTQRTCTLWVTLTWFPNLKTNSGIESNARWTFTGSNRNDPKSCFT